MKQRKSQTIPQGEHIMSADSQLLLGKLYKPTDSDVVYYYDLINANLQLRQIISADVLNGVFNAVIHSSATLDPLIASANTGAPLVEGSFLATDETADTVYLIDKPDGTVKKRAISSMAVLEARSFKEAAIMTVPFLLLAGVQDGVDIVNGVNDDGTPVP
ncbi:hypothetical protein [Corallococcus caeni]|uniref:Uncharacterized protein n=1 Tax=Corallococcus caeni TaxID=3082388 RepID=A0ABQ6R0Y4_9BACT|nr:hypothetical protein ASNO1_62370 [Corallococcus sp. NO1]